MIVIQTVYPPGHKPQEKKSAHNLSVGQLCKRLCERTGLINHEAYALKKHGCIIFKRGDLKIKIKIELEHREVGNHVFTGIEYDFTKEPGTIEGPTDTGDGGAAREGDQVHP